MFFFMLNLKFSFSGTKKIRTAISLSCSTRWPVIELSSGIFKYMSSHSVMWCARLVLPRLCPLCTLLDRTSTSSRVLT